LEELQKVMGSVNDLPAFVLVRPALVFRFMMRNAQHYIDGGVEEMTYEDTMSFIKAIKDTKNLLFSYPREYIPAAADLTDVALPIHGFLQRFALNYMEPHFRGNRYRRCLFVCANGYWACSTCGHDENSNDITICFVCKVKRPQFWTCRSDDCEEDFNIVGYDAFCCRCHYPESGSDKVTLYFLS
jgi:hypothetical protein